MGTCWEQEYNRSNGLSVEKAPKSDLYLFTVKDFKICCISNAMDGTNDGSCGIAVKTMGMLIVSVRKMMALTVKVKTVAVIGKEDRI